ncbi:MAG: nuclear transport factor 2 family protein [Acidobacteria bacterium]|nr:nuclear transport factor 2 family protein [Acidobacteriota bacterium]
MKKTFTILTALTCLFVLATVAPWAHAQEPMQEHPDAHGQEPAHDEALIRAIIADVEAGWENTDGAPFEHHYLDFEGARCVESGRQNEGLRDLIDHHVVPEGESLFRLELDITNIEVNFEAGFAWAIGDVEVKATIASSAAALHRRGYETFLFRWIEGAWRVIHTHSSTRPFVTDLVNSEKRQ